MPRLGLVTKLLVALMILGLITTTVIVNKVEAFMDAPLNVSADGAEFEIASGSSFTAVADSLASKGILSDARWFKLYARWHEKTGSIQAGDYWINPGNTPRELLQQFSDGKVRLYTFTLVPGWNHREVLDALHANEAIKASMSNEDWPALLESLGAEVTHPEGLFLPETYRFPRHTTDRDLLKQAFELMRQTLDEEWQQRNEETPVENPYETLILASIIEKETGRADERARIAGLFKRRLEIGMRLQTDPTVIYGVGPAYDGDITRQHLRTDTPYNTYTRHGLPPTPIAMPGREAINAALHPADGTEVYFVATGLGDGSHKFSDTKEEHDAAVAEYLRRYRQQQRSGNN